MGAIALADFGSTYTKLNLVDPTDGRLLAHAEVPSATGTDLMRGYEEALARATAAAGKPIELEAEMAVSSAGGGLRVAAVGLVDDLTAAAAHQVALNAGARIAAVISGDLGDDDLGRLQSSAPEIVLFAGGTDGGQADLVLANARRLASRPVRARAVVACNREVAGQVAAILEAEGIKTEIAANVMPELGRLEIEPARAAILDAFLAHVIGGKGLSSDPRFARMVQMPTPEAVLEATRLLAGVREDEGGGDVLVVDVGGATTDVHSQRSVAPAAPGIEDPLLPPPATLRTVEGDLGLRAGAFGALSAEPSWLMEQMGWEEAALRQGVLRRSEHPEWVPEDPEEARLDGLLALSCARGGIGRHCGTMMLSRGLDGVPSLVRQGPDLREVGLVVGTGGVFAHRADGPELLREALARRAPRSLAPAAPHVAVDRNYILAAAGLLSGSAEAAALRLLRHELVEAEDWTA